MVVIDGDSGRLPSQSMVGTMQLRENNPGSLDPIQTLPRFEPGIVYHWREGESEMGGRQHVVTLAGAVFAGWLGGTLSSHLFQPEPAVAQARNEVVADRFTLVDSRGTDRGGLALSRGEQYNTYFWLADQAGRTRLEFRVFPNNRTPEIVSHDTGGNTVAVLPVEERGHRGHGEDVSLIQRVLRDNKADGKADDLDPIIVQLGLIMDKLDELAALH